MRNAFSDFPPNTRKPQETNYYCAMQEKSLSVNCQIKQDHEQSVVKYTIKWP